MKFPEKQTHTHKHIFRHQDTNISSQRAPLKNDSHKTSLHEQDCNHAHADVLNQHSL